MHQCLQIAEIVSSIFAYLDGHEYDRRVRYPPRIRHRSPSVLRTLAGLTRTCTAFLEPALDVLWREIPDLSILINHLMPAELLRFDETTGALSLSEPPSADTWERLDPYIRRIQAVGIATPGGVAARRLDAETVLRPLESYLSRGIAQSESGVLLPKLTHVVYHPAWTHELYSRLLLHPHLQELRLPTIAFNDRSDWGLELREDYGPHIVENCLRPLRGHVLPAICRMHSLQTVWIKGQMWDQATLSYLSSLPSLTALALENGWSSVSFPPRAECSHRAFPSLKQLLVSIAHSGAPVFLSHINPIALEAVTVYWEYLYSYADASGIVIQQCLEECARFQQLQHFTVVLDREMEKRIGDTSLPPGHQHKLQGFARSDEYLESVFALTSLRTLEITIDVVFQLNNRFLRELAQNLPHLETLSLTPSSQTEFFFDEVSSLGDYDDDHAEDVADLPDYIPSLDGLLPLIESCHRLRELKLAVRSTFSCAPAGVKVGRLSGLRVMELWATPLDPGVADSAFIDFFMLAFPALEELHVALPTASVPTNGLYEEVSRDAAHSRWGALLGDLSGRLQGKLHIGLI
ncbi:hypothetical protein BV20DRAFT_964055 [Pilatotrama ljubarskyi]|nr:hypothetical protein BV20DRAFT_964055 [Pilatotrama ljubarskyi]